MSDFLPAPRVATPFVAAALKPGRLPKVRLHVQNKGLQDVGEYYLVQWLRGQQR